MKKTLIAMTVACVGALTVLAEGGAALTSYDWLVLETNNWFSVTKDATTGGSVTSEVGFVETDTGLRFESEEAPVVFVAADECEKELSTVTFDVKASTVPYGLLKSDESAGKIAVALYESSSNATKTNFVAGLGGEWVTLACEKVPCEGDDYKLIVRLDNRNGAKRVSFSAVIDGTEYAMTSDGNAWIDYATDVGSKRNVGFLGKGELTGFDGVQLNIVAEIIPTDDGLIYVKEADMPAFYHEVSVMQGGTLSVDEFLNSELKLVMATRAKRAESGVKVSQAYVLGMVYSDGKELKLLNEGALEIKPIDISSDKITVELTGVNPDYDHVASVTYQLAGSVDGVSNYLDIGDPFTTHENIEISSEAFSTYHYFKVFVKVTLKTTK